ncbi:hypothetical protein HY494_01885 [Candidatus Woesearchaeota archaeon]|nr:hypothetical protein [Candidatus Woesearchaeota archaeon]
MVDSRDTYVNTNALLFNTLKSGIAKEKKSISSLAAREKTLQAKLNIESTHLQAGEYSEKKKEFSFKIRGYRSELKSIGAELTPKRLALEHYVDTLKSLKKEISRKHKQQERAEKELEKNLKRLVVQEQRQAAKYLHEKTRHGRHIEKIRAEKEKVRAKIDEKLQRVEAVLRKDKQEQENKVLAVERGIKELLRKKTSLRHQASAEIKQLQGKINAFRSQSQFIEQHLIKVKDHLAKNKGKMVLRDPVFSRLVKSWFLKSGQLRNKEKNIYAKAESREREIDHKVESLSHQLRRLKEQLSKVKRHVDVKGRKFEQLNLLEQNQKKLTSALKELKEWLEVLQKNQVQARQKQHALELVVAAEEGSLKEKNKLKQQTVIQAKKSFINTLSSFEDPTYQKRKNSVGDELNKINSLNQEILALQKSYGADNEARLQLKEEIGGLFSSIGQVNRKIETITHHITKNNRLLEKHHLVSQSLQKEEALLQQKVTELGLTKKLKLSELKKGEQEKVLLEKRKVQMENERDLSLQQMLVRVKQEGEQKLQALAQHVSQERKKKDSFYRSMQHQKSQLEHSISKQEHLLEQKKREAEKNIAHLREQKSAAIKAQGEARLAELQKKVREEEKLKQNLDSSVVQEEKKLNENLAEKRKEFAKEKSLLIQKAKALRLKKDSADKQIVSAQNAIGQLEYTKSRLEARAENAAIRKRELEEKISQRDEDLKALNRIVKEKLEKIEEQRKLRQEMHQLHDFVNNKVERLRRRIKIVTKFKTKYKTKYETKYRTKHETKYKIKYKKIIKYIQKKGPKVTDKVQMKSFLKEMDTLLGKLPPKEIDEFSKSKEFEKYKEMLNKYGVN